MEVTFSLPHLFESYSSEVDNSRGLRLLLESLTALDRAYLQRHPTAALYRSGVVYGRTLIWDSVPACLIRKFGDCKTLTAWLIAENRNKGIECEPFYRMVPPEVHRNPKYDGNLYHILVGYPPYGQKFEDPSKRLGMTWDFDPRYFARFQ